jgi:hypothetical protein
MFRVFSVSVFQNSSLHMEIFGNNIVDLGVFLNHFITTLITIEIIFIINIAPKKFFL